ncbi:DUF7261 family protein [Haloplanus halobius]|uniref:DUF7261 family protein n=1 Tax=Haloplanus halobius TaxID=2934938 RepID=UPI002010985D|nr:hypothetical protein [Haloplanus sp. XH21]
MTRRRRGQLVLLAAAIVVTALVPMLLAYAQLGAYTGTADVSAERTTLTDAKRTLERSVGDAAVTLSNGTEVSRHAALATATGEHLRPALDSLESTGTSRGVTVAVDRNATAAREWVTAACPRGPDRVFGDCIVTDGVVTQTRANSTALVAVAVDVRIQGPDGTARATFVVRGVRGAVADRAG